MNEVQARENDFKDYYSSLISGMDKHSLAMELSLITALKEQISFLSDTSLWNQFVCMEECLNNEIWGRGIEESLDPITL